LKPLASKSSKYGYILLSVTAITGGGFLFNKTGEETVLGGVSWLRENQSSTITWNCFTEGNLTGPLPWSNWGLNFANDNLSIGFITERTRWGFYVGQHQLSNKIQ
jgi:hypothetical protein